MGKGSSSSQSQSTASTAPNPQAMGAYQSLLQRAAGVAATPYQAYGGQEIAPINQQQMLGIGDINQQAGRIAAAGAPLTASTIQQYLSPYTQNVVNATEAAFNNQNAQQQSQVLGNAAAQGALGGDRVAVAQALTAGQQQAQEAPVIAGLYNQGYGQAVSTAENQQQLNLAAQQAALGAAGQQVGAGTLEQTTQQAALTQARQDYYQQQGYPFEVAQWLAMMDTGVGSNMGGTSTTQGTAQGPTPNPWAQALGAGLGMFAAFANRGGRVKGFGVGGAAYPFEAEHSWVPKGAPGHGQGAPGAPGLMGTPTPPKGLSDVLSKGIGGLGKKFGPSGTRTASDGSASTDTASNDGEDATSSRGGGIGFQTGGSPWPDSESWVPGGTVSHGSGAPAAPALMSPGKTPSSPLSSPSAMKGLGGLGNSLGSAFQNAYGIDPGVSSLDALTATGDLSDISLMKRGGRIKRYANGGYADGSDVSDDVRQKGLSDLKFMMGYDKLAGGQEARSQRRQMEHIASDPMGFLNRRRGYADGGLPDDVDEDTRQKGFAALRERMTAGIGASKPAYDDSGTVNPGDPVRLPSPEDTQEWRNETDRNTGKLIRRTAIEQGAPAPESQVDVADMQDDGTPAMQAVAAQAPPGRGGAPSDVMAYDQPQRGLGTPRGISAPQEAPSGGLLEGLGIHMTPELRQGLLQAGLAMMASRRGGPGSFLGSLGEAGMVGVGAYSQSQQQEYEAQQEAEDRAFLRQKFAETQRHNLAQEELKPTYGVVSETTNPETGMVQKTYGWRDPNKMGVLPTLPPTQTTPASTGPASKPLTAVASLDPAAGVVSNNNTLVNAGPYGYDKDAPYIEKGMDVPEPSPVSDRSTASLKTDAEYYLETGKLPPVRSGKSPVAVAQNHYRNAVQNYGNALAQSRGMTPEDIAYAWRVSASMTRFILGQDGKATVSLGTAVRHLDTIQQLADAWGSGNVMLLNQIKANVSRQFGDASVTNLEAAAHIVGPEIIKALGVAGAGTYEDREKAAQQFLAARSPDQVRGAVKTVQALLGGQLEGKLRQAAAVGVPEGVFKKLVGDRPYEILSNIDKGAKGGPTGGTAGVPTITSKSEYDALPSGTKFMKDGKPYTKP